MIPTTTKTDLIAQLLQAKNIQSVRPIAPVIPVTTATDSKDALHGFIKGQQYQALVEQRLPNGNFKVLVSDKLLQIHLPENIKPGDKLALLFISNDPKPRFLLQNENFINTPKISNKASISPTGQLLNILTQETGKPNPSNLPISNTSTLTDSSIKSHELPLLLQKAIQKSGLFYESHLAKWINGRIKLEDIQQEPQGKLSAAFSTATATAASTSNILINAQSLSLVQQQLMALETGHITWNGEIWRGQQIQWDLYEETTQKNALDENSPTRWKTKLTLTLPELGKITASISFNLSGTQISLNTTDSNTAQLLKAHQIALKDSMQTAGLSVQSFDIQKDD